MRVLAADKRLVIMLFQEPLDVGNRWIHLALHVAGIIVGPVVTDSFVMNKSVRIKLSKEIAHLIRNFSSMGFITDGPDKNRWVVFVQLIS